MKVKPLPKPKPLRAVMPMGGFTSCLPPTRRAPPKKRDPLADLSDAELLKLDEVAALLRHHDWFYEYSDDGEVYRRGMRWEREMKAALATLPFDQAAALWKMYAPPALGDYRR